MFNNNNDCDYNITDKTHNRIKLKRKKERNLLQHV